MHIYIRYYLAINLMFFSTELFFFQIQQARNRISFVNIVYIEMLQKAKAIAQMYFIVGGVKPHEGAIVVRDRWGAINVTRMDDTYKWFVVETNYDPWNPPPSSDDRRDPAIRLMEEIGQNQMNPENLYKVLSTSPILNPTTTYTTVVSAKNTSLYHTMVRWDHPNEN
ncbi:N-acylethanolamine-hydrolyzing acid amidase-like [Styela clava]